MLDLGISLIRCCPAGGRYWSSAGRRHGAVWEMIFYIFPNGPWLLPEARHLTLVGSSAEMGYFRQGAIPRHLPQPRGAPGGACGIRGYWNLPDNWPDRAAKKRHLLGDHGATSSGDDASEFAGTVIRVASNFSNPTWSAFATAAVLCLDHSPGTNGSASTRASGCETSGLTDQQARPTWTASPVTAPSAHGRPSASARTR